MATTAEQVAALQKQNNEMYIQSAREQMAFQERMSNTAHQREIKDLLKAGLNPVLSATGGQGATTPNGAQADVDASSMVNYLLTEMNNENARQMNNAQVAAQRYAAEMSYKAAQAAASAQMYAADRAAETNPLGFAIDALVNPDSDAFKAWKEFLGLIGANTTTDPNSGRTVVDLSGIAESKVINWIKANAFPHGQNTGYLAGQAIPNWLIQNRQKLSKLFKAFNLNRASTLLNSLFGSNYK